MLSQFATGDAGIWLTANQVKKWKYRQIEKTHVSPWEQHSHPFTRHTDVSPIRSHIVHLHRTGCSTSLLMRPGQLFRRHPLPCLLSYGRQNVNPSSVSLYASHAFPLFLFSSSCSRARCSSAHRFASSSSHLASSARRCLSAALAAFLLGS